MQWTTFPKLCLVAFALHTTGCEIAALAIVAADEPDPQEDAFGTPFCMEVLERALYLPAIDSPGGSQVGGIGLFQSFDLATSEETILFIGNTGWNESLVSAQFDQISLESGGVFEEVEWAHCEMDGVVVVLHPKTAGVGTLRLLDDGEALDTIEFRVSDVEAMALTINDGLGSVEARLTDKNGVALYDEEIDWEVAPRQSTNPLDARANLVVNPQNSLGEVYVSAYYGSLAASLTVWTDPATGAIAAK